ncbi:Adenine-specific DNA methylase containing a Zn- ribbon (plasmid) [Gordonia sp. KTR9]|nr:Adenine-specific DNA methylase containing a Zn- ribbon [Gordonia sp. KTR9]
MSRGVDLVQKRKLIEVALPLEAINRESAREKSIKHGHPSTLHMWWARRPHTAARAVIFAQLVDDPSARPDEFPTEESQRLERERLHRLIERLASWDNSSDRRLFAEALDEIRRSSGGELPSILDPFAGGGTIPLEAQRLGLDATGSDLNPVAVLINRALLELPAAARGCPPLFPGAIDAEIRSWRGLEGLAADIRAYGEWMRERAFERLAHMYPAATTTDGRRLKVVAWMWARTVTCPNPACAIEMPLTRSWWLRNKKGNERYVVPQIVAAPDHPSGQRVEYTIGEGATGAPTAQTDGTVGRRGAVCIACKSPVDLKYVRAEGQAGRLSQQLMAIVAEGNRQREYLAPDSAHIEASDVPEPDDVPSQAMPDHSVSPSTHQTIKIYGFDTWSDLFTNRQLWALSTFSDLVKSVHEQVVCDGGTREYADAVATYLAMAISKLADRGSTIVTWFLGRESTRNTFARQALPMTWDFVEPNQFADGTGSWRGAVSWTAEALSGLPSNGVAGHAETADAATRTYEGFVVSTDPPYYDNIGYSDLSDFFYVWLRRSLRDIHPALMSTMLVPKAEELVANPYRHDGRDGARTFFEDGFREVFARVRESASDRYPITVWYAFKQSDSDESGAASTGWETLLEGMIRSGWEITSTWPSRSELSNRMIASGKNALASSIVLSLRPRSDEALTTDRRGFVAALVAELPDALRKLQQGQIAPVDLPQAAIGPGMAVFSRYAAVLEPDGSKMSVRSALARINEILDRVLNEQEGDFDSPTRFAIAWYRQHGYDVGAFGDANNLANARNTTVDVMDRAGILSSRAGKVQLIKASDLSWDYDPVADLHTSNWEALHHLIKVLERDGIAPAGDFLQVALSRPDGAVDADLVKELAHLLFRVAEANGWTKDALSFNSLVTSWPEILEVARSARKPTQAQGAFDFDEDN